MGVAGELRRALTQSRRYRLREIDLSSAGGWDSSGPVAVQEVAPAVRVERGSALAEVVLQPGVAHVPRDDAPSYVAPPALLLRIRRGMVETSMGIPFRPASGFVGDSIRKDRSVLEKRGYAVDADAGELVFPSHQKRFVRRPGMLLALPFKHNYFHWLIESLGRLLLTRELMPRDALLAVRPGASARFIGEMLAAVGADHPVYELPRRHVITFRQLYVPPTVVLSDARHAPRDRRLDFRLHPAAVHAVRAVAPSRPGGAKRLYVTRQSRRPANENEVLATLARYGFSQVAAERLSVRGQMELFAQAEVVVGAHGAGLANIVFCPEGATVVQLESDQLDEGARNLYWNLAAVCGLRWVAIVCRAVEPPNRKADFHVDCRNLEAVLRRQLPTP